MRFCVLQVREFVKSRSFAAERASFFSCIERGPSLYRCNPLGRGGPVGKGRRDQKVSSAGRLRSRRSIDTLNVACCIKYPQNAILRWSYTQSCVRSFPDRSETLSSDYWNSFHPTDPNIPLHVMALQRRLFMRLFP